MSKRHRIGLIGLGMALGPHIGSLRDLAGRAEVAACFSPNAERRAAFAAKTGWPPVASVEAILGDPTITAVGILTPPNTHLDLVRQAAAAGKDILLEKPLDISTVRAEQLVAAAEAAGVRLAVCLQHRFRPGAERVAAIVASGELGTLVNCSTSIRLWRPQSYYDQPGRGTRARDGGGVLLTQGIHTLDLMLSLAGPIVAVKGFAMTSAAHRMETEDMAAAAVRFANGAIGVIEATTAAYPGFPERIEIAFTGGSVALTGSAMAVAFADGRLEEMVPDGSAGGTGADPMAFPHDWHRGVWTDFFDAIEQGRAPRASGREALKVHRLIDALLAAGRGDGEVAVATD